MDNTLSREIDSIIDRIFKEVEGKFLCSDRKMKYELRVLQDVLKEDIFEVRQELGNVVHRLKKLEERDT